MALLPGPGPWNPEKAPNFMKQKFGTVPSTVKGVAGVRPPALKPLSSPLSSSGVSPSGMPSGGAMPPFEPKPGGGQSSTPWVPTPYPQPGGPGGVKPPWGPPDTDPYTPGGGSYDGTQKPWRPQFDEFGRPIGGLQAQGNFMRPYMSPQQVLQILMGITPQESMRPRPFDLSGTRPYQY